MHKNLNIVFWGEDSFSNVILDSIVEAGHHVKLVITPLYDNLIYKRLELTCQKFGILFRRFKDVNSDESYRLVKEINPDLCVVAHFEKLIKVPLLSIPKMGFINLHPSLLPNYRGMAPQHWPIINGEKKAGVTVHYIDEGVDTGDIIIQKIIPLRGDEYVSDLQRSWIQIYKTIMVEAIERITSGEPTVIQRHLSGSYYGKLKSEQCMIDIDSTVQHIYNLIRGVSMPYHGAQFDNVIIWRAHKPDDDLANQIHLPSGLYLNCNLLGDTKDLLILKDGYLLIDKYQFINVGNKRNLSE